MTMLYPNLCYNEACYKGTILHLKSSAIPITSQARSQAEARKPGLQHHIGIDTRNPGFFIAKNKGADQPEHPRSLISAFINRYLKNTVTMSDISKFSKCFWWAST